MNSDDCMSDASTGSAPRSPTVIPKDMALVDRMGQSVSRRARRVKRAIESKTKAKPVISPEDVAALHDAAEKGDVERVLFYLRDKGIDPNTRSANGSTALHTAVRTRNVRLINALLEAKGLDVNALDNEHKPAIAFARLVGQASGATINEDGKDVIREGNASTSARGDNVGEAFADPDGEETAVAIINLLTSHGAMADEDYFRDTADDKELTNKLESADVIDSQFLRKVIVTVALPFIFLVFVNGLFFAVKFLLVSVLFYFVAFGYFISEIMIKPPWWHHQPNGKVLRLQGCPDYWEGKLHNPRRDLKLDFTDITVTTHDGITIRGWFVPSPLPKEKQSKMCVVLVHGGGRDRRAWLRHVPFLVDAGYNCVLFDMRDHGLSSGPGIGLTFGMRERYDLVAVCAYVRSHLGFAHIAAIGTSIGGSTVIMGAALDPKIDVVIAENPLLTAAHLQDKHIQKMFGPYFNHARYSEIIFSVFRFMCSNWLNFKLRNKPSKRCQAVHVISKIAPRPVMLMHGTFDDVVPFYHSETLFTHAKEPKELWLVPEAVHCCLHNKQPAEFEYRVLRFLAKHDPSKPESERVLPRPPQGSSANQWSPSGTPAVNDNSTTFGSSENVRLPDPKLMKPSLKGEKMEATTPAAAASATASE